MTAVWPAGVPVPRLAEAWSEQREPHFDEFVTDSGKPLRSKRPGTPLTAIPGACNVTTGQLDEAVAFFITGCGEGALPFLMPDPNTDDQATFWWAEAPIFSPLSPGLYRMSVSLKRE